MIAMTMRGDRLLKAYFKAGLQHGQGTGMTGIGMGVDFLIGLLIDLNVLMPVPGHPTWRQN
jgi:hypothetical protein